ncbi:MAG: hypothetical protein GY838_16160 [bacterium]|nr:hypothetical protein [bacterium]
MPRVRIFPALVCLTLLLAGCAHQKFDSKQIEPGTRMGDWTVFRFGAFPGEFEDEIDDARSNVEDWVKTFQAAADREWPLSVRPEHMTAGDVEYFRNTRKPDFRSSAEAAGLDTYVVYTLTYSVDFASGGHILKLGAAAKMMRLADGKQLWLVAIQESGVPVDEYGVQHGALEKQFPQLAQRCAKRLMKTMK